MAPDTEPAVARRSRRCNARRLFLWAAETGARRPLDVGFQEVVHPVRTEEAEVAKLQRSTEGPDEHPQECPSDAERSRGDGAVVMEGGTEQSRRRAPVQHHTEDRAPNGSSGSARSGVDGLRDRSSRPRSLPSQTAPATCAVIEALRRQRLTGKQIAAEVGVSPATVSRILQPARLNRISDLEPAEPVRRYEREHPGEMIHIDIKKLGRFEQDWPPHHRRSHRSEQQPRRRLGVRPRLYRR